MTDGKQAWIDETVRANPAVLFMKGCRRFPRLYVKGELVGGCDIVGEMYEAGELRDMLAKALSSGADASA